MSPQAVKMSFDSVKVTPAFINALASITEVLGDEIAVRDSLVVEAKTPRAEKMLCLLVETTAVAPEPDP